MISFFFIFIILKMMMKLLDWINNHKINWSYLSNNPNAISLLEKNFDKINWYNLSSNPNAISLLDANPDKIVWCELSKNPNAISLLKAYPKLKGNDLIYPSNNL